MATESKTVKYHGYTLEISRIPVSDVPASESWELREWRALISDRDGKQLFAELRMSQTEAENSAEGFVRSEIKKLGEPDPPTAPNWDGGSKVNVSNLPKPPTNL